MSKLKIAVLFGGVSSEHEISCISAANVVQNLDRNLYEVLAVGITKKGRWLLYPGSPEKILDGSWSEFPDCVPAVLSPDAATHGLVVNSNGRFEVVKLDMVFPVLHGRNGEDGTVQGLLDLAAIPYVGCGTLASAMCMDKEAANQAFAANGLRHTPWLCFTRQDLQNMPAVQQAVESRLEYPVFVKPSVGGSSVGISRAENAVELKAALRLACAHDEKVLVEQGINGSEVECAVLGNSLYGGCEPVCSVPGEIVSCKKGMYDYEAKYLSGDASQVFIPARFSAETLEQVRTMALKAYKALGCCGLSRVDFFIREDGEVFLSEINTLPGFTPISMYAKLMEYGGTPFPALLNKLVDCAKERFFNA